MPRRNLNARYKPTEATSFGQSSRGKFGISSTRYRVVAPPLPPLPLETTRLRHDEFPSAFEIPQDICNELAEDVERIVEKYGVIDPGEEQDFFDP